MPLCSSLYIALSPHCEHCLPSVHHLHDGSRSPVTLQAQERLFPSILVLHRRGYHRLFVDQCGHLRLALSRVESNR